jgi:hypothetical protein
MNILNAIGRSDLFLKVDLSKFPISVVALIVTIPLGVKAMVIGHVVTSFISYIINSYMPGKLFGYGALAQLKEMIPIFIATSITALIVYLVNLNINPPILKIALGLNIGFVVFFISSYLLKINELREVQILIGNLIRKNTRG